MINLSRGAVSHPAWSPSHRESTLQSVCMIIFWSVCVCEITAWQWRSKNDLSGSNCDSLLVNQNAEASYRRPQKILHLNANLILLLHNTKKVHAITVLSDQTNNFHCWNEIKSLYWKRDLSHMPTDHMKVQNYWTSDSCFQKSKNLV